MNLEQITKMATCYWSERDESYVCDCAIFPNVVGMGDSLAEAHSQFTELLAEAYEKYKAGKLATSQFIAGEGEVPRATLNVKVSQDTERTLFKLRGLFNCQDDQIIDYLAHHYRHSRLSEKV